MATLSTTTSGKGERVRAQVRLKCGRHQSRTFGSRGEAERWAQEVERETRAAMTLGDALQTYRREVTPSKRGKAQEAQRIKEWLREEIAKKSLTSITTSDLRSWRDRQSKAGKAPTTIRNKLTVISQVFETARKEWDVDCKNIVKDITLPKNRPGRSRRLEAGEAERLLSACPPLLSALVTVAIETGMRRGELLGLERAQIQGRVAFLPMTKNGRPRKVPLSSRALKAIEGLKVGRVISLRRKLFPINPSTLQKQWGAACKKAKLHDLHFHDLRHEALSRMAERGLDIFELQAVSGHRTLAMLSRYLHLDVAERIAGKLG